MQLKTTRLTTNLYTINKNECHYQSGLRLTFWNLAGRLLHRGMLYHEFCSYLSGDHFYYFIESSKVWKKPKYNS